MDASNEFQSKRKISTQTLFTTLGMNIVRNKYNPVFIVPTRKVQQCCSYPFSLAFSNNNKTSDHSFQIQTTDAVKFAHFTTTQRDNLMDYFYAAEFTKAKSVTDKNYKYYNRARWQWIGWIERVGHTGDPYLGRFSILERIKLIVGFTICIIQW